VNNFRETSFTLKQLQEEHLPWVIKNFGDRRDPFVGVVEEFGEFDEALREFNDLVGALGKLRDHAAAYAVIQKQVDAAREKVIDAVGDIIVYSCDSCSIIDIQLHDAVESMREEYGKSREHPSLVALLGRAAHAKLKLWQGIRGNSEKHRADFKRSIGSLYLWIEHTLPAGVMKGVDMSPAEFVLKCAEDTWAQVKQRDWTVNKLTGEAK
jgi:hypothetical protein